MCRYIWNRFNLKIQIEMKKIFLFLSFMVFTSSNAQIFDALKDVAKKKVTEKATNLVGENVKNAVTKEAITTNFKDCDTQNIKSPEFASEKNFKTLCSADFTEKGYVLTPGYYEIELKSFCLKAGTYAPSKGDGYLYAPLKGPKEELVSKLVKNWYNHSEIEQTDVQALLWAIIAKASFKNLDTKLQLVAAKLLSSKDILALNKMGLDFVPSGVMSDLKSNLPKPVQLALEAENKIRQLFSSSSYSYSELEKYAMLAGFNKEKSSIAYGTWGLHPSGFWVSYHPSGYSHMKVRIYVPETAGTFYYIPSNDVAVPANTSSQRLMLSDVKDCR